MSRTRLRLWQVVYLDGDSDQQAGLCKQGKGLVVSKVLAIIPHCVIHGSVGDKEEDKRAVDAVEQTLDEGTYVEVHVELSRLIKLRVLQTPAVTHILKQMNTNKLSIYRHID